MIIGRFYDTKHVVDKGQASKDCISALHVQTCFTTIIKGRVVPYVHISKAAYRSRFYFIKSRFKFRRVYPPNLGLGRGIKQINNYFFMQNPENFNLGWLKFLDEGGMLPCCCWMPDMCSSIGTKKQTNEENTFSSIN